ncbi:MAG: HAD-IA family hydrolase [Usitatibacter sp.]
MPAFKGVIFDLFHTLTARESQWSDVPATWSLLGVDRYDWDRAMLQSSRWRLVGEERDPYVIFRRLVSLCDASIPDDRVREVLVRRTQRFTECFQRVPAENVGMLKRLRASGYKLALLSNADAMEVTAYAAGNLQGLFDVEVFSCDAGHVKPEPEIFHSCLEALQLPASECVFVGDGGSDELQGAQAVGLRTILVSGVIEELFPERLPERIAVADRHVKWAHEVDGLIENWAPACRGVTPHG